jgi:hypothetical protein
MKAIIFKEKTKPSKEWIGTQFQKEITKDKFGELQIGEIRSSYIDTKWGQLGVPYIWMGKKIKITVEEIK